MPDKKENRNTTVDWAERLKASLDTAPADDNSTPVPTAQDDDLAALLRAQLAHSEQSAHTSAFDLDTSEFEEETEEPTFAPAPAEEPEPDDLPWEEDDEEDLPDELPEPETIVVYHAEEIQPEPEPEPVRAPARRYTFEPVPYDEEEILSPDGVVGDVRLMIAEEESNALLAELHYGEKTPAQPKVEKKEAEASPQCGDEEPVSRKAEKKEPAPRMPASDLLQLGLDDILPNRDAPSAASRGGEGSSKAETENPAARGLDYTRHMLRHPRDREEAVRDAELYIRLGYEKQLTRTEQQEAVEEARRRARERRAVPPRNETSPVERRREYTDRRQTPGIKRAYTRSRRLCMTRLCVALVGALFCLLHDLLGGIPLPDPVIAYANSSLYPMVGVVLTVLFSLPFLSRLGRGLASLFAFEPTRYAVSALALLVAVVHGVLTVFFHSPSLYGGVALFMLAVAAATEYVATVAEETAFSVVSAGKTSFVLSDETTPASAAFTETFPDGQALTAVRTRRVSDFFARTGRYNPFMGRLNYLLPVSLLTAITCAGLAILNGGSVMTHGLPVFTATYLACLPASYLMSMSLPLLTANRLLSRKGAAVLGTSAPSDLCGKGSACLLIRDGDAVSGLHRKEITLRDDPKADLWRQKAACLFRLLECPLWKESPLGDEPIEGLCVEVAETEEDYVRLFLIDLEEGETNEVMMGSREALTRRGVRLPKASMEQIYKKTEESRVVYMTFDGTFRIAYAVEYRLGHTFAEAAKALSSLGGGAALVTYDPLVEGEILRNEACGDGAPVKIIRPGYVESVRRSCSAGVVATGRSLDLLYPYAACHRMKRVYGVAHLLSWLTLPVAMLLSLVTVFVGDFVTLSSAVVATWQILLTGVSVVISLLTVTRRSLFIPSGRTKKHTRGEK